MEKAAGVVGEERAHRHEKTCGACGSFIPLAKPGEAIIVCPKCGTEWEIPAHVRREAALATLERQANEWLASE